MTSNPSVLGKVRTTLIIKWWIRYHYFQKFLLHRSFKTLKKNIGFPKTYLCHILPGSTAKRYSHSMPLSSIHLGALDTLPPTKSINAPTPHTIFAFNISKFSFIHFSCFGVPIPTNRISGRVELI